MATMHTPPGTQCPALGATLIASGVVSCMVACGPQQPAPSSKQDATPEAAAKTLAADPPAPRIIQEALFRQNDFYGIRGTIFNPTDRPMKDVVVKYYLYKSHMGKPSEGILVQQMGGLVEARLKYLPPRTPIEFTAYSENAPTGGRTPEIDPEITAEWDQ